MMDRPHLDVDSLEAAEGALSIRELFVGADGCRRVKYILRKAGAQRADAIESRFGLDLCGVARQRQIVICDGNGEVLGGFVAVDDRAHREPNLALAAQWIFGMPD